MSPQRKELIVTHPGGAHFDEIAAISLILATFADVDFEVQRRDASVAELEDPSIWVIDTGNRHEPEKRNFDHHQSLECPASFVLVADYLGLSSALSVLPWWEFKDSVDRIGPEKSAARYGAGDTLVNRNPVEDWLVGTFAAEPGPALPLLRSLGTGLIADARSMERQIAFWSGSRRLLIGGVPAMIGETRESFGLEEFRRLDANPADIVISLDRRSDGWRLFRFDGAPVDFSLIADRPEVEFAHKSGFLAKTRDRLGMEELIALVSKAIVRKSEAI
jgi:hypothetical protein